MSRLAFRHLLWAIGFALASTVGVILNVVERDYWWAAAMALTGALCLTVVYFGWKLEERRSHRWLRPPR